MTDAATMSPAVFAVEVLGERGLYDWQVEALEAVWLQDKGLGFPQIAALAAANGSGKTAKVVAILVLWFLGRYPKGQAIITSGSFRQVEKQLWPALRVYRHKFPAWNFLQCELRTDQGGFAIGFSTDDPGRAEGWHPKEGPDVDPVLIVVDEAKTVPDAVFDAFDRCTRRFELWVSSPGKPWGRFFSAFHALARYFYTRKVRSDECPHIDPAKRERDKEKYGEDSALFRSMHLAEFTEDEENLVASPEALAKALDGQAPAQMGGEVVAFCDFAAGRDENVLAVRRGNSVRIVKAWRETDTVQACRQFVELFKAEGLSAGQIWGDADGLGHAFCDMLAELKWPIQRFHGGTPSTEPETYRNTIAEVWITAVRDLERGRIHVGQLDPVTFRQITTRKVEWAENSSLRLESKEKMRAQGKASPDRADALLGAIACGRRIGGSVSADAYHLPEADADGLVGGF